MFTAPIDRMHINSSIAQVLIYLSACKHIVYDELHDSQNLLLCVGGTEEGGEKQLCAATSCNLVVKSLAGVWPKNLASDKLSNIEEPSHCVYFPSNRRFLHPAAIKQTGCSLLICD